MSTFVFLSSPPYLFCFFGENEKKRKTYKKRKKEKKNLNCVCSACKCLWSIYECLWSPLFVTGLWIVCKGFRKCLGILPTRNRISLGYYFSKKHLLLSFSFFLLRHTNHLLTIFFHSHWLDWWIHKVIISFIFPKFLITKMRQ